MKNEGPIHGNYKIQQHYFNNPKRIKLNWTTESQISLSRYIKYYNNMETKNKINWARIWQIIQAIITMILATETATRSL